MWEKPRVFLSYAREDQIVVSKLYRKLRDAGVRPWMDTEDIGPGEDWQAAINSAIGKSSIFLAFLSPRSIAKAGVLREEMETARKLRARQNAPLRVIPVRIEPCEAPELLRDLQWIDLYDPDGWERLLRAINPGGKRTAWALAATVLLGLVCAGAIWIYQRPCTFSSARANGACSGNDALVGATFWRLRPSLTSDPPAVRSIFQPPPEAPQEPVEWTPVRVHPATELINGDRFYASIECTRSGYMYVVNREQYSDGRTGPPELIFPTSRERGGDNHVEKDGVLRLPAPDDNPPFFKVAKENPAGYTGEIFTVIILPRPIPGLAVPKDHVHIPEDEFARWVKAWQRPATALNSGGGKELITEGEVHAHKVPGEMVQGVNDPVPEIIYRVSPGTDGALWVDFLLRVKS